MEKNVCDDDALSRSRILFFIYALNFQADTDHSRPVETCLASFHAGPTGKIQLISQQTLKFKKSIM